MIRSYEKIPNLTLVADVKERTGKKGRPRTIYLYRRILLKQSPFIKLFGFDENKRSVGQPKFWTDWRLMQLLTLAGQFLNGDFGPQTRYTPEAACRWLASMKDGPWFFVDRAQKGRPACSATLLRKFRAARRRPELMERLHELYPELIEKL